MHMYNFFCSDSLLYFFLFLSTLHSVYTRDCSCIGFFIKLVIVFFKLKYILFFVKKIHFYLSFFPLRNFSIFYFILISPIIII